MTNQYNICSVCGSNIPEGRPAFAGYDSDNHPVFVGACCASVISELASPTYWGATHNLNISVDDSQQIWRYMDFPKFVSMITQRGLYFPRADKLEDPFEGAVGLANRQNVWNEHYLNCFREMVLSPPPGYQPPSLTTEEIERQAQRLLSQLQTGGLRARSSFVSCWHANTVESEALWRLYSPPPSFGIAIKTDVLSLWNAVAHENNAVVGKVHYIDFKKVYADYNERLFCKRLSLAHENEVRAVIRNRSVTETVGHLISCDLSELVKLVVISPFSPSWFEKVVATTIEKFGFKFPVHSSELLEEPFY